MSKNQTYFFGELPTLSTISWSSDKLKYGWKWTDRSMESVMQKFIDLNQKSLSYLGIVSSIESIQGKPSIKLTTSRYVGSIPILSPMNGKAVGDLAVSGRFGENAEELISLIDKDINLEYSEELRLVQDSQLTPPIFFECCKYIDTYLKAENYKWQKFKNVTKIEHRPESSTLWAEYAQRNVLNPLDFLTFKNKRNIHSTDHPEWAQLNYVLQIAIQELESPRAPIRTRATYSTRIAQLKIRLRDKTILPTNAIKVRMSDPLIIKELKAQANNILFNKTNVKMAWRMDYAEFFERYVQFLMANVAKKKGVIGMNNPHFGISVKNRPQWLLQYIEPDIVLHNNDEQVVIDAKYKSHMYNWSDNSDDLKDTFRHDFHQILAYCSLNSLPTKQGILVYPFSDITCHKTTVHNPMTHSEATVYLVGIPIERNRIEEIEDELSKIITFAGESIY